MENISKNPGLQQITERIFSELEHEALLKCQDVNTSWKDLLKNPITWLKICVKKGLPSEFYPEWLKLIQKETSSRLAPGSYGRNQLCMEESLQIFFFIHYSDIHDFFLLISFFDFPAPTRCCPCRPAGPAGPH